jgi:hypothetical protein
MLRFVSPLVAMPSLFFYVAANTARTCCDKFVVLNLFFLVCGNNVLFAAQRFEFVSADGFFFL